MDDLTFLVQPILDLFAGQPYLQAAGIMVATFAAAWLIAVLLLMVFKAFTSCTKVTWDDEFFARLRTPLVYSLLMVGLSFAVKLLPLGEAIHNPLINGLRSIGVIVWMTFLIQVSKLMLTRSIGGTHPLKFIKSQTLPLFRNLVLVAVLIAGIYIIFSLWGVDMTAWMASAGIIGIAVGFAAKDTLANLFSGVFILADMPYKLGDYVLLDTGERGAVTHIGLRSTRMLTRDDVELTIPNSIMGNSKIVNQSGGPYERFRIRIPVGVAYGSDIDQVRTLLMAVAKGSDSVAEYPEARVRFRAFGGSSLDFELLCWIDKPAFRGRVTDALLTAIYHSFNEHEVEIPYAKTDVYIKQLPER